MGELSKMTMGHGSEGQENTEVVGVIAIMFELYSEYHNRNFVGLAVTLNQSSL
jgi:hypothetical protein